MDIPHWLIVFAIFAIIAAAFARQQGELRLEQTPKPIDTEDEEPSLLGMTETQARGVLDETPRSRIQELTKARDDVQNQIDVLATELYPTKETRKLIEQLSATLRELDECIAAEANPDQHRNHRSTE